MELFGVGPLEFLLVLVLALVIMGPQDMVNTARKMGQWVYRVVRSPTWRAILDTSQDLRNLPQKIVRDAGIDDAMQVIKDTANQVKTEMAETTREISSEMQAANSDIKREMQTAVQDVNAAAQEVNADLWTATAQSAPDAGSAAEAASAAAEGSPIAGDSKPLTETALAASQAELATEASPVTAASEPLDGESSPESILWPESALADAQPETAPSSATETVPQTSFPFQDPPGQEQENPDRPATDPYVAGLETFARALGGSTKSSTGLEQNAAPAIPQTIPPEMIASAPAESMPSNGDPPITKVEESHPWAPGLTIGSSVESEMQTRFQTQMAQSMKSFEELDAKPPQEAPPADPTVSAELAQSSSSENSPG